MVNINFDEIFNLPIDDYQISKRPILVYGCGSFGENIINMLRKDNIIPIAVCDGNATKIGTSFLGHTVMTFEKAIELFADFDVVIASLAFYNEIKERVLKYIPEDRIYNISLEQINTKIFKESIENNRNKLVKIFNRLSDDKSKEIMLNVIKGKLTNNPIYFEKAYSPNQYFNELTNLNDEEYFLDGGAFDGDTMKEFIRLTNGKYKKVYCFEPSEDIYKKLEDSKRNYLGNDSNIILYNKGLYNCNKTIGFNDDLQAGGHRVDNTLSIEKNIEVAAIDSIIKDKVTLIKMDIEGSELQALEGARETILKYRPKLAISVYHKAEDLVKIPQFIMDLGLDYKYYLRHHGISPMPENETVFYAV